RRPILRLSQRHRRQHEERRERQSGEDVAHALRCVGEIGLTTNRAASSQSVLGHDVAAAVTRAGLLLLNVALAGLLQLAAPPQPVRSDRVEYEYAGAHGLEPGCPHDVYCYRVLVPVILEQVPLHPDVRWRVFGSG